VNYAVTDNLLYKYLYKIISGCSSEESCRNF